VSESSWFDLAWGKISVSSPKRPSGSDVHPALYSVGNSGTFSGGKKAECRD